MSHSAVSNGDVAHLPLKVDGKADGAQAATADDVKMEAAEKTDLVLRTFRCLIADLCHQFGCGHPG